MTTSTPTHTVTVERSLPHPPAKIWRALTEGALIEQWLMKNDFQPVVNHPFKLTADWGSVDCKVLAIDPPKILSYTWTAYGLETIVTFTLCSTPTGALLRMEQSGFRSETDAAYKGATFGWQAFLANLDRVVAQLN
jgi:uncharacterized protein YndB with AHSA1/START domain